MPKKSREEVIRKLKELEVESRSDGEYPHEEADELLLEYIDDKEITQEFKRILRWYA